MDDGPNSFSARPQVQDAPGEMIVRTETIRTRGGVRRVVAGPRSASRSARHHPGSDPAFPTSTRRAC